MTNLTTFLDLGITEQLNSKLQENNLVTPTAVQTKVIPEILENKSLLFQSETGTGKTLAFLLPILQNINEDDKSVQAIILSPTHELSSQIKGEIQKISNYKTMLCIGGTPLKRQIETLKEKPKVVIGSPVRIKELIFLKKLKVQGVKTIVFDEIDRLIEPEIRDETIDLLKLLNSDVQLIGCSATVKPNVKKVFETALSSMRENSQIEYIELPLEDILQKRITHWAIYAEQRNKIDTLRSLISAIKPEKLLIFTAKTDQVAIITDKLQYKKIDCVGLHSKTDKIQRKTIIDRFKSGKTKILITSDLAARGLDIQGVTHIVQMDLPSNDDFFIHRAGRTGRAGNTGINIVIGDGYEMKKYANLEKKLKIVVYPKVLHSGKVVNPMDFDKD
ncbi:MAG: DEAD/DEAH box helicase [Treponemataceae bacterium]|jgi:superfamily II DNA/RNA helicase|nr:DEAD/DEAH box helicase [Treponemataceae bacterium]